MPMIENLPKIATLYGVSVDWLLGLEGDEDAPLQEAELSLRVGSEVVDPEVMRAILVLIRTMRQQRTRERDERL